MKTRYWRLIIFMVWMEIALFPATIWSQASVEISEANQLYNQNQFQKAAELYERAIAQGGGNGYLYYNLGNSYFRMGKIPKAILNYAKAQNLLPRNEEVEANLNLALSQTVDQLDGRTRHTLEEVLFWISDLNLREHWMILFWINLGFWIVMAVGLHHRTATTRFTRNTFLVLLLLASVSTGLRWHHETRQSIGVTLPQQADIHSSWNDTTVVLFQLHQGALVAISQEKEDWYEIELPDTKKGWTLKSNIAR